MLDVEGAGLGAASYIIMNSESEGLVAELEPNSVASIFNLGSEKSAQWFLVQTNSDREDSRHQDPRRLVPENYLRSRAAGVVSSEQLFEDILSKTPNFLLSVYGELIFRTISSCYVDAKKGLRVVTWHSKSN